MPFLLRATPRLDLAGWTLRSEVNHHGDRAFGRHTRPDPERYEYRNVLASHPPSGQYAPVLSHLGDLRLVQDVTPAEWVLSRLAPWDLLPGQRLRVCSMVPSGFEAYGRLLHPAYELRDGVMSSVSWAKLARRCGRELEADSSFASLVNGGAGETSDVTADSIREPADGDMDPVDLVELVRFLGRWTTTPDHVWFCVWEGYGWPELPRQFEQPARVQLEHRACLLGEGSLDAGLTLPMGQAPTIWWPEDRTWCVRTDIDGYSTYVAASTACIEALVALQSVEVLLVDPGDEVPGG